MESSFQLNEPLQPRSSATNNNSKLKKTRYRVPTVCVVCRRRKMKCDKAKPHCTSCVKNGTTHLCVYEDQPWASSNEMQKLKDQIYQLQNQNAELKNLLSKKSASDQATKDYNQNLIIPDEPSVDPVLELTRDFNVLMLKESKMSHYGSTSYMASVNNDPILREMFEQYINSQNWGINLNKFFLYDQGVQLENFTDHCSSLEQTQAGSVFEKEMNKNSDSLIDSINQLLPQREVMMDLVDNFFSDAYNFVPYIDETSFRKNLESIISVTPEGKAFLVLSSVNLLATVSILLTVLRFAFIALPSKRDSKSTMSFRVKKIIESGATIGPEFIEYAKACIANAGVLRKPALKHIQALLMIRLYRYYAPEDGDESSDSTIFLALIVQMAKMHGLHRDPSTFTIVSDHATANIWRKIWYQLMYLDATQAYCFGCPLLIDDEFDTRLPVPSVTDTATERNCIDGFQKVHEVTMMYREIVKTTSRIISPPKRSDIEKTLRQVEFAIQRYPYIAELTTGANEGFLRKVTKMKDLIMKLNLYTLHASSYYILMLTCGPQDVEAAKRYTSKAIESAFTVFRFAHHYTSNPSYYTQGMNFESFLSACVLESSKRVFQIIASFNFRDSSGMFSLEKVFNSLAFDDSKGISNWLSPIANDLSIGDQSIIRLLEFVEFASKLQHRYFVCWRIVYINKLCLQYMDNRFPGKLEHLEKRVKEYNQIASKDSNMKEMNIGFSLSRVEDIVNNENEANKEAGAFWSDLLDSSNQSRFDYLAPDFERFKSIGDPFFANNSPDFGLNTYTFQDFDNGLQNDINVSRTQSIHQLNHLNNALSFGDTIPSDQSSAVYSNPSELNKIFDTRTGNSVSTVDGVSPNSSENSNTMHKVSLMSNIADDDQQQKNFSDADPSIMRNNTPGFDDHELALQVAKSMFGSGGGSFNSDYYI